MQTLFGNLDEDTPPAMEAAPVMAVLVPYPIDKTYTYAVPAGMEVQPGDYVTIPLGQREVIGVVWGPSDENVPPKKLKSIITKHDLSPMPKVERDFIAWVAGYTMAPIGMVLKMALSVPAAMEEGKGVNGYKLTAMAKKALSPAGRGLGEGATPPTKPDETLIDRARELRPQPSPRRGEGVLRNLSPSRRRVLETLEDGHARKAGDLEVSSSVLKGLVQMGLIESVSMRSAPPCAHPDIEREGAQLSLDQKPAAAHLVKEVQTGGFFATLIDGVTGAGKTEVYFEAVAEALRQDKQVLILLPEIALSNAFLDRFKSRFGCAPAMWHSSLSPGQRRNTWRGVAEGKSKVIVGARSALFLPYQNLGLIIVDEEHDPAYKQEDGVIYHARDMAVVRAHLSKIPIVLVSATPSLETMVNAWSSKYTHLHLPDRHGGATLPDIHLLDLRVDKPERQHFIAPTLMKAIEDTLARGEQVLLFLNRRGYAPLTLCRTCGQRMECPRCTAWLVEHKSNKKLQCHHCGFNMPFPKNCPTCGDEDCLAACGPGVERIYEEVSEYFPEARTIVLASDTAETHEELKTVLTDIRERRVDIVIGTQIIAKGHHFPGLTLVGVIDADLGLGGGDLRAAERTYQLLHQVAGRAGREELKGNVYLQTWIPENRVMQALSGHGRDSFLDVEAQERERSFMPPYSRLAGIIVSGRDERQVDDIAKKLGQTAPQGEGIKTLGPAPAPLYRLRGNFRKRLLVQADKGINLQKTIENWMVLVKVPSTVRVQVDIDPQSFL